MPASKWSVSTHTAYRQNCSERTNTTTTTLQWTRRTSPSSFSTTLLQRSRWNISRFGKATMCAKNKRYESTANPDANIQRRRRPCCFHTEARSEAQRRRGSRDCFKNSGALRVSHCPCFEQEGQRVAHSRRERMAGAGAARLVADCSRRHRCRKCRYRRIKCRRKFHSFAQRFFCCCSRTPQKAEESVPGQTTWNRNHRQPCRAAPRGRYGCRARIRGFQGRSRLSRQERHFRKKNECYADKCCRLIGDHCGARDGRGE